MRRLRREIVSVVWLACIGCERRDQAEERAAPPAGDTTAVEDTAALVGDTVMARDTVP